VKLGRLQSRGAPADPATTIAIAPWNSPSWLAACPRADATVGYVDRRTRRRLELPIDIRPIALATGHSLARETDRMRCYAHAMVNHPIAPLAGEAEFWAGVDHAQRFFMGNAEVQHALRKLTGILDAAAIPYAIAGAMALNEYGYRRVTVDVDVLLTRDGLDRLKREALGRGYVEKFPGSKGLRDTEHGVAIDILLAGEFPGDGKPKPVRFPDPATVAVRGAHGAFLPLEILIELKLASGLSAPHRLKDLADVLELIRATALPEALATRLDPSVRAKYSELWSAAQTRDDE